MMIGRKKRERGQILVFVALAFLVMLGASAVAVDLGYGMLEQRRLQNAADAAALAAATEMLDPSAIPTDGYNVALQVVLDNTNNEVSPPDTTASPQGTALTWGIEIGGDGVRVALRRTLDTFFARAVGMGSITVSARAHAGTSPMGVLPIAVKRYDGGDTRFQLGENGNPAQAVDYLSAATEPPITAWPEPPDGPWPGLLTQQAVSPASPGSPGPNIPILGTDADPNVPATGNAFNYWVGLHVRDLTSSPPTFIAPVDPSMSVQQWNNIEADLFLTTEGFQGNLPYVGQEISAINGIDAQKTVGRMEMLYDPGETVIAMVYDGTVHRKPNFELEMVSPSDGQWSDSELPTYDETELDADGVPLSSVSPSPVEYDFRLTPVDDFSGAVSFDVEGLEEWQSDDAEVHWQICYGSDCGEVDQPKSVVISLNPIDLTLKVWGAYDTYPPGPSLITGARTINIIGQASGFSRYQLLTASARVNNASFSITPKNGKVYDALVPGQGSATFTLNLSGSGFVDPGTFGWTALPGSTEISTPPTGITYTAPRSGSKINITITADGTAPLGLWKIRVPVGDQDVLLLLESTYANGTVGQTTAFVRVLGYTAFRITAYNAAPNCVWAEAVSGLYATPEEAQQASGAGTMTRLIGWSQ